MRISRKISAAAALAFAGALAGCQTAVAPVAVTRFHVAVPPAGAGMALVPAPGMDAGIEYRNYESAVAAQLARVGYRPGDANAAYRAIVDFDRDIALPPRRDGSPVSVGVGGATGSYGSGLGLGIGIDLSGPPKGMVFTRLSVRIVRASDGGAVWEGRAETQARENAPAAQPGIAAGKLAAALFQDYPGRSGETITVP